MGFEKEREFNSKFTAGKSSYIERNIAMIDDSNYCIFYYDKNYQPALRKLSKKSISNYQPKNGTKIAYNYAKHKKKIILNLFK